MSHDRVIPMGVSEFGIYTGRPRMLRVLRRRHHGGHSESRLVSCCDLLAFFIDSSP